ncbi:uncharacterized protein [Cherax quadricarinatus]|uniref:uncharacterized protein n=1 Tax=Cherax quadricarinatus TaxID=27406 RepID=UPI00387EE0C3
MAVQGEEEQNSDQKALMTSQKGQVRHDFVHAPFNAGHMSTLEGQVDHDLNAHVSSNVKHTSSAPHIANTSHKRKVTLSLATNSSTGAHKSENLLGSVVSEVPESNHQHESRENQMRVKDDKKKQEEGGNERVEAEGDLKITGEESSLSLDALTSNTSSFLHRAEMLNGGLNPRTAVVSFPQADFLANVIGLSSSSWPSTAVSILFFGWPFLLLLLYIVLIFLYPNRRSEYFFEKHMSTMIETWSHLLQSAEDNFFQFMEDVTDPGEAAYPANNKGSVTHHSPASSYNHRQDLYFGPAAEGSHMHTQNSDMSHGGYGYIESLENTVFESTFVDPTTGFMNPIVSFRPEDSQPLRDQFSGDISRLTNDYNIQNEIVRKDKHNFVNVVLGAQHQHIRPSSSLVDHNVIRGSVLANTSHHPQPPRPNRPSPHLTGLGKIRFDDNVNFHFRNSSNNSSGFSSSPSDGEHSLEEGEWTAASRPLKSTMNSNKTSPERQKSKIKFPRTKESRGSYIRRNNPITDYIKNDAELKVN